MSFFTGREKVSKPAILIGKIFNKEDDGLQFLDLTLAAFEQFDESNREEGNTTFSDDINHLTQSAMASLTTNNSDKFQNRIDAYFYIYHRLEEYYAMQKKSAWFRGSSASNLEIFRQKLNEILSYTFASSKGTKPNLYSNDKDLLKSMNIVQHLSSIKTINTEILNLFFALCKLSMQSSLPSVRLKWIDILSKVENIKVSLQYFVTQYVDYIQAFEQFPLDTPAYIYLIQTIHPLKQSSTSPFAIFISLFRKLNLKPEEFFDSFQPLFIKNVRDKRYEPKDISKLFQICSKSNPLFNKYILLYSSNVNNDNLWNMFVHLCTICDINDIITKQLPDILAKRISGESIETFNRYTQLARECLTEIKPEFHPCFLEIFEKIYDTFITTQIQDPQYNYRFTQADLKELLKIGLLLTSTHSIKRPSCLLLIREILFKIDNRIKNTADKIKHLFQNFNSFDENLYKNSDPTEIIEDEWLKDFIITNSQIWLKLDHDTYRYLCNNHKNNRWIIHIWSRIIHFSLLKLTNDNLNDTLLKLNDWMKTVKHNIYDPTDILTSIFVIKLFELIIAKHTKSILSLPNIEIIMTFIFSIRQNQSYKIDTAQVDFVIRNGREILQEILQLKGK